jgi:hypothetical protein
MYPLVWVSAITITLIAIFVGITLRRLAKASLDYRGVRIVTCPETQHTAGVVIDAWHALATALTDEPEVRLKGCSRWPERAACGQECARQIAAAPQFCTIHNILREWHEGKCCLWCGKPVSPIHWTNAHPVLLTNGQLKQWDEIPVDQLSNVLTAAQPICFPCYARRVIATGEVAPPRYFGAEPRRDLAAR